MSIVKNATITIGSTEELQASFSRYGAAVTSLILPPEGENNSDNVVLSLGNPSQVVSGGSYAGAVVGALSGRIPHSTVFIDDNEYSLAPNEGRHFLHGGETGLSSRMWEVESHHTHCVIFSLRLHHLEDGLPGNRVFRAKYSVKGRELNFQIKVESDAVSPVNLTNHMYFNLSGDFHSSALDHQLLINSEKVLLNNSEHIPQKVSTVQNTHFDFLEPRVISDNLNAYPNSPQINISKGYNNCYLLKDSSFACKLFYSKSARQLVITTSYPALVFYSGGFLDESILLKDGAHASSSCAVALEPQFEPGVQKFYSDGENVVTPQKAFKHYINYAF